MDKQSWQTKYNSHNKHPSNNEVHGHSCRERRRPNGSHIKQQIEEAHDMKEKTQWRSAHGYKEPQKYNGVQDI